MSESEIQQRIQMEAAKLNCWLLRNNSGAMQDATGRVVRYGLGAVSKKHDDKFKSSDFVGITEVIITPAMVGMKIGVFTAFEIKDPSWNPEKKLDGREQGQKNFLDWVTARGGIASFLNSIDGLKSKLGK